MTKRIGPNDRPYVDLGNLLEIEHADTDAPPPLSANTVRVANEQLAAYAHETWADWMRHLFESSLEECDGIKIPHSLAERWQRQMNTSYADLPEHEKVSDREEALKIQSIFFSPLDIDPNGG